MDSDSRFRFASKLYNFIVLKKVNPFINISPESLSSPASTVFWKAWNSSMLLVQSQIIWNMTFWKIVWNAETGKNIYENRVQNLCSTYFPFKYPKTYHHISISIIFLFKKRNPVIKKKINGLKVLKLSNDNCFYRLQINLKASILIKLKHFKKSLPLIFSDYQ